MVFKATFLLLFLLFLLFVVHFPETSAASYVVGDNSGWSFAVSNWSSNKTFRAGDELNFNYARVFHNVVKVNAADYNNCTAPDRAVVHQSGRDKITLTRGDNCFICTFPFHCQMGMKVAVHAI